MGQLTKSQEDCLRTISVLSCRGEGVRLTDIAIHLGISKASACNVIKRLEKGGFVERGAYRLISLTPDGEREAQRIMENFRVISMFLIDMLNVSESTARADACELEHAASEEMVNALRLFLRQAKGSAQKAI